MRFQDFHLDPSFSGDTLSTYRSFYREIWEENEYERFGVEIPPGGTVVDLGGSIGLFARYAVHRGAGQVYTFEFNPQLFDLLRRNTLGVSEITPTRAYLGHGPLLAHELSLLPAGDPLREKWGLDRVVGEFGISQIDFLKVDIEGGEYELFEHCSADTLSRIQRISMECHIWQMFEPLGDPSTAAPNAQRFLSLLETLSLHGFRVSLQKIHRATCLYMLYACR